MLSWYDLVQLPESDLARLDIAEVNLTCAAGLPGSAEIDLGRCLDRLDYWSRRVKQVTEQNLPLFRKKRYDFNNSEAYFRVLSMATVLWQECGVRYNPEKIPADAPFTSEDAFIHGVILGDGGTCASLPVVCIAVGRRLGYPLKLVQTFRHFFCRWDQPGGERFNIEVNNTGMACHPDDYY